jgi:hypothetical protein
MGIGERLRTFGFLARYKGSIGTIKKRQQDRKKSGKFYNYYSTTCINTFNAEFSLIPLA